VLKPPFLFSLSRSCCHLSAPWKNATFVPPTGGKRYPTAPPPPLHTGSGPNQTKTICKLRRPPPHPPHPPLSSCRVAHPLCSVLPPLSTSPLHSFFHGPSLLLYSLVNLSPHHPPPPQPFSPPALLFLRGSNAGRETFLNVKPLFSAVLCRQELWRSLPSRDDWSSAAVGQFPSPFLLRLTRKFRVPYTSNFGLPTKCRKRRLHVQPPGRASSPKTSPRKTVTLKLFDAERLRVGWSSSRFSRAPTAPLRQTLYLFSHCLTLFFPFFFPSKGDHRRFLTPGFSERPAPLSVPPETSLISIFLLVQ